jgi:hypothetical protein
MQRRVLVGTADVVWALAGAMALSLASSVQASNLPLSYSTTYDGTNIVTTPTVPNGTVTVVPNVPTSYNYGNTYNGATPIIPGTTSSTYPNGFGFYDDFLITISASSVDSISTTLDLGTLALTGLQERLYNLSGNTLPTLGTPAGGTIDAWSTPISGTLTGTVNVLPATQLVAGTYVLEIRGTATGANGGSYSGTLNVTPVPLPAALPLLLSGLGLLGTARRRSAA